MSEESEEFDRYLKEEGKKYKDLKEDEDLDLEFVAHFKEKIKRKDGGYNIHYSICVPSELNIPFIKVKLPILSKQIFLHAKQDLE